jgi:hypothetical protein
MHTQNITNSTVLDLVSPPQTLSRNLADFVGFSACDHQRNLQVGPLPPDGYLLLDVSLCPSIH